MIYDMSKSPGAIRIAGCPRPGCDASVRIKATCYNESVGNGSSLVALGFICDAHHHFLWSLREKQGIVAFEVGTPIYDEANYIKQVPAAADALAAIKADPARFLPHLGLKESGTCLGTTVKGVCASCLFAQITIEHWAAVAYTETVRARWAAEANDD